MPLEGQVNREMAAAEKPSSQSQNTLPGLSGRLLNAARYVIRGEAMADIGSDHAQLACFLVRQGWCPKAICGELRDGPFRRSVEAVRQLELAGSIQVRQGNGLEVLQPGEVATVVIAGMGGKTIQTILESQSVKAQTFARLVLQANDSLPELRIMLASLGWPIEEESVIKEGKHFYVTMSVCPCSEKPYSLSENEFLWGPYLLKHKQQPEIRDYLLAQKRKYEDMVAKLPENIGGRAVEVKKTYQRRIKELEAIIYGDNQS